MWRGTREEDQVPVNLTFHIRRNAEWAMLMLGESIFSLLVVPVDHSFGFIVVFVLGTVTVANVYCERQPTKPSPPPPQAAPQTSRCPKRPAKFGIAPEIRGAVDGFVRL